MNIATIEESVADIVKDIRPETFIYQLLNAYGKPKASITRLQKGNLNLSKIPGEVVWKKNLLFRSLENQNLKDHFSESPFPQRVADPTSDTWDLHLLIDRLRKSEAVSKHDLRFVITTDWKTLLAIDTKTAETLDIPIAQLHKHVHFFLPWAGLEKQVSQGESLADIKAAYKMAKLYDQICKDNPTMATDNPHSLNVFLCRLLFCFFAEDTDIFPNDGMFTNALKSHTQEDGSDLDAYLDKLFEAMNEQDKSQFAAYIKEFPYVNGGLFQAKLKSPMFSRQSRKILLECGDLDWSEINPDIFGSMMQAVVHTERRSEAGMHYTSVSNIMKVIEPLLLNELWQAFEQHKDNATALERLRTRLSNICVFDPACGSGNFLVIAFKELRKLEIEIYLRLRELKPNYQTLFTLPQIQLTQFFGIEIDDFAHEIATLSLWLAEHQMNVKYKERLKVFVPPLPLKPSGHISCENATRIDWEQVCPKAKNAEIYVLGNPPYLGARNQDKNQKADMAIAFSGINNYKKLDYVACWFKKGADYIENTPHRLAFVATNSICQGELVAILWPLLFKQNVEITFAHRPFKWSNNAKHNAGVTVAIIGLRALSKQPKYLYSSGQVQQVENINPYLANGKDIVVEKRSSPLSSLQQMSRGDAPTDNGNFMLTPKERSELLAQFPECVPLVKRVWGANELIKDVERWCLWLNDNPASDWNHIPFVRNRVEAIRKSRLRSPKEATQRLARTPHLWDEIRHENTNSVIVPTVTSEEREYIPVGFLGADDIVIAPNQVIYRPEHWIVSLISSRLHNVWIGAVAGRLEERIRYSIQLCYNTFPCPDLTQGQKESLENHLMLVLAERERHPEKTLQQLYDPEKMPPGLRQAHKDMDTAVERCYRSKPFLNDDERLDYLFKLYETMLVRHRSQE